LVLQLFCHTSNIFSFVGLFAGWVGILASKRSIKPFYILNNVFSLVKFSEKRQHFFNLFGYVMYVRDTRRINLCAFLCSEGTPKRGGLVRTCPHASFRINLLVSSHYFLFSVCLSAMLIVCFRIVLKAEREQKRKKK